MHIDNINIATFLTIVLGIVITNIGLISTVLILVIQLSKKDSSDT